MVRRRTGTAILVAIGLMVATTAYGVIATDRPQVESVDSEWGTVTDERTEVETRITVDDPLLLRVGDAAADVSYTVTANDIVIASERDNRVRLADGERTVTVSTWVDHDEIPAWWASHVNRNETTTVRVDPDVVVDYAGVRRPANGWTSERTFHTDLLEPLQTNESQRFRAYDRTMFVVEETDAQWGDATGNRTPVDASATVTNPTRIPVPITEIEYTIRLNGIVVGEGVAADQTVIPPGSTRTIDASAAIDNAELDDWWVTHVRNDETSNLTVEFDATLEYAGIRREVPLEFLSYERTFRTDLFAVANASAQNGQREQSRSSTFGRERTDGSRPSVSSESGSVTSASAVSVDGSSGDSSSSSRRTTAEAVACRDYRRAHQRRYRCSHPSPGVRNRTVSRLGSSVARARAIRSTVGRSAAVTGCCAQNTGFGVVTHTRTRQVVDPTRSQLTVTESPPPTGDP